MSDLSAWALRWGIPQVAIEDLRRECGAQDANPASTLGESEAAVQNRVRLEASRKGLRLWRNNVGACYTKEGGFLRYGIANDSAQMNALIKSSDLIGIRPVTITPSMAGSILGQFVAREVKAGGWRYGGGGREEAQLEFLQLVATLGGDASFCSSDDTL